jgi:DNA-directed RNA polymerase
MDELEARIARLREQESRQLEIVHAYDEIDINANTSAKDASIEARYQLSDIRQAIHEAQLDANELRIRSINCIACGGNLRQVHEMYTIRAGNICTHCAVAAADKWYAEHGVKP